MAKKKEKAFQIVQMSPNSLIPYVKNNKIHDDEQIDNLAGMIAEFGFDQPIVVDEKKVIIKGHARWLAAKKLGLENVPVIVADHLDEHQVMASRIADNKVSSTKYDMENMKFDLGTLERVGFNLNLTGVGLGELDELLKVGDIGSSSPENINRTQEQYDQSDVRQIVLIFNQEEFEEMLGNLQRLREKLQVESNTEAIKILVKAELENE